jgi:hypothetical protein
MAVVPTATALANDNGSIPLFVTFDAGIPVSQINAAATPFVGREQFVWGVDAEPERLAAWRAASPSVKLSYYMPYSRAPAASLGFDLAFWQREHPDWIL